MISETQEVADSATFEQFHMVQQQLKGRNDQNAIEIEVEPGSVVYIFVRRVALPNAKLKFQGADITWPSHGSSFPHTHNCDPEKSLCWQRSAQVNKYRITKTRAHQGNYPRMGPSTWSGFTPRTCP